jgi:hypothetical protein
VRTTPQRLFFLSVVLYYRDDLKSSLLGHLLRRCELAGFLLIHDFTDIVVLGRLTGHSPFSLLTLTRPQFRLGQTVRFVRF